MYLTHRNRVEYSRLNRLEIHRCGQTCLQVSSHSGEGSLWLHLYGKLCKTDAHIKPSPLERGDRGAVGEIHLTVAPSPKRIADATHLKKPPRKNVVAKIISPLIPLPDGFSLLHFDGKSTLDLRFTERKQACPNQRKHV